MFITDVRAFAYRVEFLFRIALSLSTMVAASIANAAQIDARFDIRSVAPPDYHANVAAQYPEPNWYHPFNDEVYFTVRNHVDQGLFDLWVTKGDADSTHRVDIGPLVTIQEALAVGANLYLSAADANAGIELWALDKEQHVSLVKDINPGNVSSFASDFFALNNALLFYADDGVHGIEPWRSEGTDASTQLLVDTAGGSSVTVPSPFPMINYKGRGFFTHYNTAGDSLQMALWATDGTSSGTSALVTLEGALGGAFVFKDRVCFTAQVNGDVELWCSDGTAAGTLPLLNLSSLGLQYVASEFVAGKDGLFFAVYASDSLEHVYVTDGSVAGTHPVSNFAVRSAFGISEILNINGNVYFIASASVLDTQSQVWKIDPGALSITAITSPSDGGSTALSPRALTNFNGTLAFAMTNNYGAEELWLSNGTPESTQRIAHFDFYPERTSSIFSLSVIGQSVYFNADDGSGREPWVWTNHAPRATADRFRVRVGPWTSLDVLANDVDSDGQLDSGSIEITSPPSNGSVEILDGRVRYRNVSRWWKSDQFSYRVRDTQGALSNEATVSLSNVGGGGGSVEVFFLCALAILFATKAKVWTKNHQVFLSTQARANTIVNVRVFKLKREVRQ